jgi:hypothetical protein
MTVARDQSGQQVSAAKVKDVLARCWRFSGDDLDNVPIGNLETRQRSDRSRFRVDWAATTYPARLNG